MPKFTIGWQSDGRMRIELNYVEYKAWEKILGDNAKESVTLLEDGKYWKTLLVEVGGTEYRFSGPVMVSRDED